MRSKTVPFIALVMCSPAVAVENLADTAASTETSSDIEIVMRVSREFVEELLPRTVSKKVPVRTRVEGYSVWGRAMGEGRTQVVLNPSDERAEFDVTVVGKGATSLTADVGAATVSGSSCAEFTTRKRVGFDGSTFVAAAATTSVRNCTKLGRVCPKKRGIVGGVIRHVGRKMAMDALPEINIAMRDATRDMISQAFDDAGTELILELNRATQFDQIVSTYFPSMNDWQTKLATRSNYFVVGIGPPSARLPNSLTQNDVKPYAYVELWLRTTPGQALMLELLADMEVTNDVLREFLPEEDVESLADDIKLAREGDWSVIYVGLPKSDSANPAPDAGSK